MANPKQELLQAELVRLRAGRENYAQLVAANPQPAAVAQLAGWLKNVCESLEALVEIELGRP